ncbi:hypothetical protein thsrh120_52800 [Rhizobium sp. No.120]
MTFRQALELGAAVRKGKTGTTVVFARSFIRTETNETGAHLPAKAGVVRALS